MYAPHTRQLAGRPAPPLRLGYILHNYQYVADCGDPAAIEELPPNLGLHNVTRRLYRITGVRAHPLPHGLNTGGGTRRF
jgi:hypothetical protein